MFYSSQSKMQKTTILISRVYISGKSLTGIFSEPFDYILIIVVVVFLNADLSAPTFNHTCPSGMVFYTGTCDNSAAVSWRDPKATDNSGTIVMTYPVIQAPVNLTIGLYEILYTATDMSGNTANCSFIVQVTSKYIIRICNRLGPRAIQNKFPTYFQSFHKIWKTLKIAVLIAAVHIAITC